MYHDDVAADPHATSNHDTPASTHFGVDDVGWQALGPAVACTALSTAIVAVRWYTRRKLARCLGLDDYVILLSLAISWAMTGIIGVEVHHGFGVYDKDVPASMVAKLVVVNNNLWITLVNITKLSILIQYLRVFSSPIFRRLCISLMVLLLPAAAWGIFGGTFLCSPTEKLWDPQLPGHCMSARDYWFSVAGIDIGLDFLTLLLPIPAIFGLHLPRKQKIGLLLVFLLGFFVCVGNVVASGVWAIIWSSVEANVGIMCASLLALKPLVAKLCPKLMEEAEPPQHSVQLPMIEAGVWPGEPGDAKIDRPATATTLSKDSSDRKWSSSARMSSQGSLWSPIRLSEVENIHVLQPEDVPAWGRARERLSLFDILSEDIEEARARVERRDSSSREPL